MSEIFCWMLGGWIEKVQECKYRHFVLVITLDYSSPVSTFYVAVQFVSGLQKAVPVLSQSVCTATSSPEHITVTVLVLKWSYTVTVSNWFFNNNQFTLDYYVYHLYVNFRPLARKYIVLLDWCLTLTQLC